MNVKIISNEKEYDKALILVYDLMQNPNKSKKEYELMNLYGLLISHYEEQKWTIAPPDPIEAIKFRMDQMGLKQADLVPLIHKDKSIISKLLNRKIGLSIKLITDLHKALKIPLESLMAVGY